MKTIRSAHIVLAAIGLSLSFAACSTTAAKKTPPAQMQQAQSEADLGASSSGRAR